MFEMNEREYRVMRAVEDTHWWYDALKRTACELLRGAALDAPSVLDAGCGTGGNLSFFRARFPRGRFWGLDKSALAVALAGDRGAATVVRGSAEAMPFAAGIFDAVFSFDVIYMRDLDEEKILGETHRVLKRGGLFLVNVPAFECLRGRHDEAVGSARRYRRGPLAQLLISCGFTVRRMRYWNSLLFPLVFARRRFSRHSGQEHSDVGRVPGFLNEALKGIVPFESALTGGAGLPFGSSLMALAEKR